MYTLGVLLGVQEIYTLLHISFKGDIEGLAHDHLMGFLVSLRRFEAWALGCYGVYKGYIRVPQLKGPCSYPTFGDVVGFVRL